MQVGNEKTSVADWNSHPGAGKMDLDFTGVLASFDCHTGSLEAFGPWTVLLRVLHDANA